MGVNGQSHVPAALCPGERTPGTHFTGGWVGHRAGLDTEVRGKILCPCRGSNPRSSGRPVGSQTLYWLSYPGSYICRLAFKEQTVERCQLITLSSCWVKPSDRRRRLEPGCVANFRFLQGSVNQLSVQPVVSPAAGPEVGRWVVQGVTRRTGDSREWCHNIWTADTYFIKYGKINARGNYFKTVLY
jgi:hypothetical protein